MEVMKHCLINWGREWFREMAKYSRVYDGQARRLWSSDPRIYVKNLGHGYVCTPPTPTPTSLPLALGLPNAGIAGMHAPPCSV